MRDLQIFSHVFGFRWLVYTLDTRYVCHLVSYCVRNLFLITEISDLGVPCLYLGQERYDMFVHKRFEEAAFKLDALGGAGVTVEATVRSSSRPRRRSGVRIGIAIARTCRASALKRAAASGKKSRDNKNAGHASTRP